MTADQRRVCAFIDAHPPLMSALYDLGLTCEETLGSEEWPLTVRVVALYAEAAGIEPPWVTREAVDRAVARAAEKESPAAQARRRARETGEAPPACAWTDEDPPCSCLADAPLMTMRDAPGNDAAAEAFVRATTPTSADPQHASMSIAEIESRQRVSDGLIRDERNDVSRFFWLAPRRPGPRMPTSDLGDLGDVGRESDAYIGAGAVYVAPDGPAGERAGEPMRRLACGCVPRVDGAAIRGA